MLGVGVFDSLFAYSRYSSLFQHLIELAAMAGPGADGAEPVGAELSGGEMVASVAGGAIILDQRQRSLGQR